MGLFGDRFDQPQEFYNQLDPSGQQAAGQQFQQQFGQSQDPQMQQMAQQYGSNPDPQQLGQMHDYAQQNDPSMLSRVMDHPLLDAALVGFGAHEWKEHEQG